MMNVLASPMSSLGVAWTDSVDLTKKSKTVNRLRLMGFKVTLIHHKLEDNKESISSLWSYLMNYDVSVEQFYANQVQIHYIEKYNLLRLVYQLDAHKAIKTWLSELFQISCPVNYWYTIDHLSRGFKQCLVVDRLDVGQCVEHVQLARQARRESVDWSGRASSKRSE